MSRGGARNYPKGTGARVNLMCRVDPETMTLIDEIANDCGLSRGQTIDAVVKAFKEDCEKEGQMIV